MYLIILLVYAQLFGNINTYGYPGNQGEGPGDEASEIREREQYLQNLKKSDTKPKRKHLKATKSKEHSTEKSDEPSATEDLSKTQNSTEKSSVIDINEDCPWGCFWKCQSYCPSKCCNNPNKCELSCREFCAPYCPSKCCAPGSKRLPKLKLNFVVDTNDTAESSYQQEKEQSEQINLVNKIDALKKTTIYAAKLMGLPSECPLACARICLPGLCRHDCCGKAHAIGPPLSCPMSCSEACYPGLCTGQCCTRPPPTLNSNGVPQMPYLNFERDYRPKPFIWNSNPYIRTINEDLMTDKLRKGKIILPDTDQYKALMLISSLSKKQLKTLLKKSGIAEKKLAKRSVVVS